MPTKFSTVRKLKRQVAIELLDYPSVAAVGVGFLDPDDEESGPAIVIYAEQGLDEKEYSRLKANINGEVDKQALSVPTRVEICGKTILSSLSGTPGEVELTNRYKDRIRPVRPGYSVGFVTTDDFSQTGTAGLTVVDRAGKKYIIGCAHTMAEKNGHSSGVVLQHGSADGGGSSDIFAVINNTIEIKSSVPNHFDAAICRPAVENDIDIKYGANEVRVSGSHRTVRSGWQVKKSSRSTGDSGFPPTRTPLIDAIDVEQNIHYDQQWSNSPGTAKFTGLVAVRADYEIAKKGDSGCVWLKYDDNKACLMGIAGSSDKKVSYCSLIQPVLDVFEVNVPDENGHPLEAVTANDFGYGDPWTELWSDENIAEFKRSAAPPAGSVSMERQDVFLLPPYLKREEAHPEIYPVMSSDLVSCRVRIDNFSVDNGKKRKFEPTVSKANSVKTISIGVPIQVNKIKPLQLSQKIEGQMVLEDGASAMLIVRVAGQTKVFQFDKPFEQPEPISIEFESTFNPTGSLSTHLLTLILFVEKNKVETNSLASLKVENFYVRIDRPAYPDQDQENEMNSGFSMGIGESEYNKAVAQTFTVGRSGSLCRIDFDISEQRSSSKGDLLLDIRRVDSRTGIPKEDDDDVLFSHRITSGTIAAAGEKYQMWTTIDLGDSEIPVSDGDRLAIVLRADEGGVYGASGSIANTYSRGGAFWRHDDHTSGSWEYKENEDFAFRTYVRRA